MNQLPRQPVYCKPSKQTRRCSIILSASFRVAYFFHVRYLLIRMGKSIIKQLVIFFENIFGDVEDGVGDEKGREDVDGIVEMTHQDDGAEEDGRQREKGAPLSVLIENQRHQERETGVGREE